MASPSPAATSPSTSAPVHAPPVGFAPWPRSARQRALLTCGALLALSGCAGHAARTEVARAALDAGQPREALAAYNEELEVKDARQLPADVSGEASLLILDRSMILQQLEQYELSSRDLELADKQVEMLDFSRSALDDIGKYIFSDDTGPYKAPPYEKLMLNTMNMVNYLAAHDLNGARIEARRLAVMQKYLRDHEDPARAMLAPGSYLAGFVFEKSGKPDEALRYYDEALAYGSFPSLVEPLQRLGATSGYTSPRIRELLRSAPSPTPSADPAPSPAGGAPAASGAPTAAAATEAPAPSAHADRPAELLVIISYGRVPAKVAQRVPIGLALTYASGFISPTDASRANALAAQGLVTWVNYPELEKTHRELATPGFALDGKWQTLEGALAVEREARDAYERQRGAIVASAITRMISRVVAGETARAAAGDDALGLLLSLGTQATLSAADTPDTRSWATLPARIALGRVLLTPGVHQIELRAQGERRRVSVDAKPGSWHALSLTVLR